VLPIPPWCRHESAAVSQPAVRLRGHRLVLVDEVTEHVVTMDIQGRGSDGRAVRDRHVEVDASVRALFVVVPDVAAKDSFEVTLAHHEQPVETFCPHRSHPTLRVSVGPRRSNRCLDDPDGLCCID
jgi:hypothetical protein